MLMSQLSVTKYRYYRWLLASFVGVVVLLVSLYSRFYQEVKDIEQSQQVLAGRIVTKLNQVLMPAHQQALRSMPLLNESCENVIPTLRYRTVQNAGVRAMLLVKNDNVYCSSIFGARQYPFNSNLPGMANNETKLALRSSMTVSKGTPILQMWLPDPADRSRGVLQVFSIELLASFLLEPQEPYARRVELNVANFSLGYNQRELMRRENQPDDLRYTASSSEYPFSITVFGPSAEILALEKLPHQIPLALLISLLAAYVAYLISANRMSLSYYISHAITHRKFLVYCQPIIDGETGRCMGVEILLRLQNKRQGWVSPDVFIPLAEQHGLIIPLTRYLLSTVVENLALFPPRPSFYISINVAAEHFNADYLLKDINRLWQPAQPMPSLVLELTERTELAADHYEQIKALKEMGIMLAIDDFGTGHSSLSYLKKLNPDILKIDRSFTAAIGTDAINATVTDTIITLANALKIRLVAEGVETEEQLEHLRTRGVNALQGFYFAKPMPINEFPLWLQHYEEHLRSQDMRADWLSAAAPQDTPLGTPDGR